MNKTELYKNSEKYLDLMLRYLSLCNQYIETHDNKIWDELLDLRRQIGLDPIEKSV